MLRRETQKVSATGVSSVILEGYMVWATVPLSCSDQTVSYCIGKGAAIYSNINREPDAVSTTIHHVNSTPCLFNPTN